MKFSSSGLGRKNGFYFKVDYEFYLDGEKAAQPWMVSAERRDAEGRVSNFVRLHRTHRFENKEGAQQFCEDIADGKYSIEELRKEENAAEAAHKDAIEAAELARFSVFLQDFKATCPSSSRRCTAWTRSFGSLPATPKKSVSACRRDRRNLFSTRSPTLLPGRFSRPLQRPPRPAPALNTKRRLHHEYHIPF